MRLILSFLLLTATVIQSAWAQDQTDHLSAHDGREQMERVYNNRQQNERVYLSQQNEPGYHGRQQSNGVSHLGQRNESVHQGWRQNARAASDGNDIERAEVRGEYVDDYFEAAQSEQGTAASPADPQQVETSEKDVESNATASDENSAVAQEEPSEARSEETPDEVVTTEPPEFALVPVGSKYSFPIAGSPGFTAAERADIVTRRIEKILKDPNCNPADMTVVISRDKTPTVMLGAAPVLSISKIDSLLYGMPQIEVAHSISENLKAQIKQLQPVYLRAEKLAVIRVLKEHRVLLLLLQVAILLVTSFVFGELVSKIGQPKVIGQLVAGIVLGPSVLGAIAPELSGVVFPVEKAQSNLLEVVSWLGVIFLLMLAGMEVNMKQIWEQRKPACGASVLGALIPFFVGIGMGFALPENLMVNPNERLPMALYLGTLLSVSSVPVVAKILIDMKLMQLPVGQITLTAALVNDIFGCFMIAVVSVFADAATGHGGISILRVALGGIAFLAALVFGRKLFFALFARIKRTGNEEGMLTVATILLLLAAATTQFIGLHVVLGAFAVGILIAQTPAIDHRITQPLHVVTMAIFAPIFFAAAGLNVNLTVLSDPNLLFATVSFSLIVCVTKISSAYFGARLGKLPQREALAVGVGVNAYGAMGLIFATIGFSLGILTVDMYSIIVVMALVTTAIAPPLLRVILRDSQTPDADVKQFSDTELVHSET